MAVEVKPARSVSFSKSVRVRSRPSSASHARQAGGRPLAISDQIYQAEPYGGRHRLGRHGSENHLDQFAAHPLDCRLRVLLLVHRHACPP
jgi:hypothetical protein